jgi:O-antigen biosynthesis protein WbqP
VSSFFLVVTDVLKRVFDLSIACLLLTLLSPIMLIVALLIKLTSPGPALFVQARVGRFEKTFTCLKFRTMIFGVPNVSSHEVGSNWITPLGRVLRVTKVDELPQLINVVRGEMSMVGPRPCLPSQVEVIQERRLVDVFAIRPGITGIAQLSGIDMSDPGALAKADRVYMDKQSFFGDLKILIKTAFGLGSGDAARP